MKLHVVLVALTVIVECASFVPHAELFSNARRATAANTDVPRSPWSLLQASTTRNHDSENNNSVSRRHALTLVLPLLLLGAPPTAQAREVTTAVSGSLSDLPPNAVRSYLQYRTPLQISADYYLFDLRSQLQDVNRWGEVGEAFVGTNARGGQGQPSAVERNFVNPMRILGLSMPPEEADILRQSQFDFERAMAKVSKATRGIRRDLPVEISKDAVPTALQGWEEGRVALNKFFVTVNESTGLPNELQTIPPLIKGDVQRQIADYGRSPRKYNDLMKKTKLCQNRGGPTLSAAWGQLMVSGYLQDSCGIPDMELYFFQ